MDKVQMNVPVIMFAKETGDKGRPLPQKEQTVVNCGRRGFILLQDEKEELTDEEIEGIPEEEIRVDLPVKLPPGEVTREDVETALKNQYPEATTGLHSPAIGLDVKQFERNYG